LTKKRFIRRGWQQRINKFKFPSLLKIVRCNVATLWECIHRTSGSRFCVKAIDKRRFKSRSDEDMALREVSMYRSLFSKCRSLAAIPKLHDLLEDQTHYYIVQDYEAGGGNLGLLLRDHGPLSEAQLRVMTRPLLEAVAKLHAQSICHNDLHLENILIRGVESINEVLEAITGSKSRNTLKLCDLGRAICVSHQNWDEHARSHIRHSSLYYVAPENLAGTSPGLASDMWSIGIILYVCFCGQLPFRSDPHLPSSVRRNQLKKQICQAAYTFPKSSRHWAHVSRTAKQFISSLLHPDPVVRMTCHEALSHPWLAPTMDQIVQHSHSCVRTTTNNPRNVQLAEVKITNPLIKEHHSIFDSGKKSLVHRLWGKIKQKKHRVSRSETDLSTTASSTLSSMNSAGTGTAGAATGMAGYGTLGENRKRRHQSM
jgi:serine/threonine protein kinase